MVLEGLPRTHRLDLSLGPSEMILAVLVSRPTKGGRAGVSTRKRRVEREQEAEYFHESIHDREIVDGILNRFKSDRQLRSTIIIDLGFRSGTLAARDPLGIKDQV